MLKRLRSYFWEHDMMVYCIWSSEFIVVHQIFFHKMQFSLTKTQLSLTTRNGCSVGRNGCSVYDQDF
jgi:hypothetical protein